MKHKLPLVFLVSLLMMVIAVGVSSAQDKTPRALLPSDLVINSSFEPNASFWSVTNAVGDKVKCGGIGHITDCAFVFKGSVGEKTTVQQTYTPGIVDSGSQYVFFNVNVRPFKAGLGIKFFVKIKFKDGAPALKKGFNYTSTGDIGHYEAVEFSTSLFNPANVKKIVFGAINHSTSGKAYVDDFTVGAFE